jgi:hypothetical protein
MRKSAVPVKVVSEKPKTKKKKAAGLIARGPFDNPADR